MELSGLLAGPSGGRSSAATAGRAGLWVVIAAAGAASAFLNNTPIVVWRRQWSATSPGAGHRPGGFLIPLSYATILGGRCTLIGTSTNLLVNDMARAGPAALRDVRDYPRRNDSLPLRRSLSSVLSAAARLGRSERTVRAAECCPRRIGAAFPGPALTAARLPAARSPTSTHKLWRAPPRSSSSSVVAVAALGGAPIAASPFPGPCCWCCCRAIRAEEAYRGLRPEVLMLIAGMVVIGLALEETGLASRSHLLIALTRGVRPLRRCHPLRRDALRHRTPFQCGGRGLVYAAGGVDRGTFAVSPRPFLVGS